MTSKAAVFTLLGLGLVLFAEIVLCFNSFEEAVEFKSDFVDPTDMGSYSHGLRRNVKPSRKRVSGQPSNSELVQMQNTELNIAKAGANSLKLGQLSGGVSPPCTCPCPTLDDTSVMAHMKRLVASLLTQMNVRSHLFGPGEAITIDLQAEISYEDYTTLNSFLSAKDGDSAKFFQYVDLIISELLHIIPAHQSSGVIGNFHEWVQLRIPTILSFKFWLTLLSLMIVGFIIVMLCLQFANARHQPVVFIAYGILIFFVLSCLWSYAGLQEDKKAQSTARLRQFDTVPDDCNYNSLGLWGSLSYFVRVKVVGYADQCEEYYKEMVRDPFHRSSPIEAISETFSKLIFHPMEYIGERMGKFFSGVISAVPFWIQPILLILIFVFSFLALFGYRIRTPFISIEPAPRPRILGSPERVVNVNDNHAIIERPAAAVVPANSRDASTSTDDLEAYILQQARENQNSRSLGAPPASPSFWNWENIRDILFSGWLTLYASILQLISAILRDAPPLNDPGLVERFENDFEQIWGRRPQPPRPRPILPDQEVLYPHPPVHMPHPPVQMPHPPVQMPLPPHPQPQIIEQPQPQLVEHPHPQIVEQPQPRNNLDQSGPCNSSLRLNEEPSLLASGFGWVSVEDDLIVVKEIPCSSNTVRKEEAEFQRVHCADADDDGGRSNPFEFHGDPSNFHSIFWDSEEDVQTEQRVSKKNDSG